MKTRSNIFPLAVGTVFLVLFGLGYRLLNVGKIESLEGYLNFVPPRDGICGLTREASPQPEVEGSLPQSRGFHAIVSYRVCEEQPGLVGKRVLLKGKRVACSEVTHSGQLGNDVSCFEPISVEGK